MDRRSWIAVGVVLCVGVCATCAMGCSKARATSGEGPTTTLSPPAPPVHALTDEKVVQYIHAYKALRAIAPSLVARYPTGEVPKVEDAHEDFSRIEGALKGAGFSGYAEFVQVNATIAWAFSTAQGQAFITEMDGRMADGDRQIQTVLDDPDVPEETKRELRAQRESMRVEYAKNKRWAEVSMKTVGRFNDAESAEVVLRHRKELEEAFRGA